MNDFTIEFLMNSWGNSGFRIIAPDGKTKSGVSSYTSIASLKLDGRVYAAVTQYYDGGTDLPIEEVFEVVRLKTIKTVVVDHTDKPFDEEPE